MMCRWQRPLSKPRSLPTPAGAMATHLRAQPARSLSAGSSAFCAGGARLPCARAPRVAAPRAARRAVGVTAKVQGNIKKVSRHPARLASRTACPILLLPSAAGLLRSRCAPRRAAGGSTRAQRSTCALQGYGVCSFRSADAPLASRS